MRHAAWACVLVGALMCSLGPGQTAAAHQGEAHAEAEFTPPAPGTYSLHAIMPTPAGEVLDTHGRALPLAHYTRGKITLLSLIYTRCSDADGCPRASAAFAGLRRTLRATPQLAAEVRLVSLSFDPVHDTPRALGRYAAPFLRGSAAPEWHFLTTRSAAAIRPLLEGFGQDLRVMADEADGVAPAAFTHLLKVFLIDARGRIREIYTTAYLLPQLIVNDVLTLRMEEKAAKVAEAAESGT